MKEFNSFLDLEDVMEFDEFYTGDLQSYACRGLDIVDNDAFWDWGDDAALDCLNNKE